MGTNEESSEGCVVCDRCQALVNVQNAKGHWKINLNSKMPQHKRTNKCIKKCMRPPLVTVQAQCRPLCHTVKIVDVIPIFSCYALPSFRIFLCIFSACELEEKENVKPEPVTEFEVRPKCFLSCNLDIVSPKVERSKY